MHLPSHGCIRIYLENSTDHTHTHKHTRAPAHKYNPSWWPLQCLLVEGFPYIIVTKKKPRCAQMPDAR